MTRSARTVRGALGLLLALASSSCLDAEDGVDMTVYLYWDQRSDSDSFRPATCRIAGVERMEWTLVRQADGEQVAEGVDFCCDGPERDCGESIDWVLISEPSPGDYTLNITGFDHANAALWGAKCDGLRVTRFDETYSCDIPGPPE